MSYGADFLYPSALTPQYLSVDKNSNGNNTLIAAVAGKRLLVLGCVLISAGSVNIAFEDGADGTPLTGDMPLTVNSGFTLPLGFPGWFITSTNTLLNLELSAGVAVAGTLVYTEVV